MLIDLNEISFQILKTNKYDSNLFWSNIISMGTAKKIKIWMFNTNEIDYLYLYYYIHTF